MDDEEKPPPIVVTAAWRKEQQAKRDAYEAKRRAWVRTFERGTGAGEEEARHQRETAPPDTQEDRRCGRCAPARAPGWHDSGQAPGALHILTRRGRQPFLGRASRRGGETPVTERRSRCRSSSVSVR